MFFRPFLMISDSFKKSFLIKIYFLPHILKFQDAPGEDKDKDKEGEDKSEKKDGSDEPMDTSKPPETEIKKENGNTESTPKDRLIKDGSDAKASL